MKRKLFPTTGSIRARELDLCREGERRAAKQVERCGGTVAALPVIISGGNNIWIRVHSCWGESSPLNIVGVGGRQSGLTWGGRMAVWQGGDGAAEAMDGGGSQRPEVSYRRRGGRVAVCWRRATWLSAVPTGHGLTRPTVKHSGLQNLVPDKLSCKPVVTLLYTVN